jgi:hypothetical protein
MAEQPATTGAAPTCVATGPRRCRLLVSSANSSMSTSEPTVQQRRCRTFAVAEALEVEVVLRVGGGVGCLERFRIDEPASCIKTLTSLAGLVVGRR